MKVEYLLAHDDGTWETDTVDVPLETDNREQLVSWAENNLTGQTRYRRVVLFGIYSLPSVSDLLSELEEREAWEHERDARRTP